MAYFNYIALPSPPYCKEVNIILIASSTRELKSKAATLANNTFEVGAI